MPERNSLWATHITMGGTCRKTTVPLLRGTAKPQNRAMRKPKIPSVTRIRKGEGVSQDDSEAVAWYRKAAEQGDAHAQGALGYKYFEGRGVQRDHAEAARWYRKAARQGDEYSRRALSTRKIRVDTLDKISLSLSFFGSAFSAHNFQGAVLVTAWPSQVRVSCAVWGAPDVVGKLVDAVSPGRGIAVDASGNAYVTGVTESSNFPTTAGVFQPALAGTRDAFVLKLNSTGSALVYASYLCGALNLDVFNSPFQYGFAIAVDAQGSAYVAGATDATDFPVTVGAYQLTYGSTFSGEANAFVTKVSSTGSSLIYSTYIGGTSAEAEGIAIDSAGNAYIAGLAMGGYPTTAGAYQTTYGGGYSDGFVTKLNPKGSALVYSTYIGGNNGGGEFASAITVDSGGNAYITGLAGAGFPVTTGAYQTALAGFYSAFVTKLNAAGTALVYSTYGGDRI